MNSIRPSICALHTVASCGVLLFACAASAEEKPKGYEVITGFDAAPQSLYWYDEAIVALNHDMAKDGFLFRMYGTLAVYNYASSDVPGGNVDGKLWQFDLMPGYQVVRGGATFGGYVGLDYQDSQLTPNDPTNQLRGTKAGVKVAGSFDFEDEKQPIATSFAAEYSTAFDTYFAELRLGARVCKNLFIGPDGSVDGDTGYNAQRLGGFAKYTFALTKDVPLKLTLVAGHQFASGSGDSSGDGGGGFGGGAGTYGTIDLDANF